MILGIDIGGSTTKIIGTDGGSINTPVIVKADDKKASLYGALGKFIDINDLDLSGVDKIMLTGVGASYVKKPIYGRPTYKVPEFTAIGKGGLALSNLSEAIIVSMGTGTAIVKASRIKGEIVHLGGTGIGGGTIEGLGKKMIGLSENKALVTLAEKGDKNKIDLTIGDITDDALENLPRGTTASNFGNVGDSTRDEDLAYGILNLVFESIATTARFAMVNNEVDSAVLIGNLSRLKMCEKVFKSLGELFNINFVIPKYSEFATALGAALSEGIDVREDLQQEEFDRKKLAVELEKDLRSKWEEAFKAGYDKSYLEKMVTKFGIVDTIKKLLYSNTIASGFYVLMENGYKDYTVEAHVISDKYKGLFTKEEIEMSLHRLNANSNNK